MPMEKNFDSAASEAAIYANWENQGAFKAGANAKPDAETFTIMIPPPNVTGALHVGHAFNNTLQDILIRWHRMQGHDTLWQPGQDHAGIATQLQVEKMLAANQEPSRAEMGREAFTAKVWEWKEQYGSTIINQLKRLGASCDWDRNAFTMDKNFHDAVLKVFVDLYNKNLIYRGKRLVNWDPHFETAISDLEVENIEVDGHMWHFKYPLADGATYEYVEKDEDGNVTLRETRDYISIATTRPETMLGDGAVAVHPDDERYAPIVDHLCEIPVGPKEHRRMIPIIKDEYPVMDFGSGAVKITGAHDLNDYGVAQRNNIPMYRLMDTRAHMRDDGAPYAETSARARAISEGADWDGAEVDTLNLVPDAYRGMDRFVARDAIIKQITADGLAVMTTAEDPNTSPPSIALEGRRKRKEFGVWRGPEGEYYVCSSSEEALVEAKGQYPQNTVEIATNVDLEDGVFYRPDRGHEPSIVFLHPAYPFVENKKIMQPFCDRSKVVMEPMLTDQWYVDAARLAGPALDAVNDGRVTIMPESGKKVYHHWMENIEPWCISRQLWWGHQIPVWYGPRVVEHEKYVTFETDDPVAICATSFDEAVRMYCDYKGGRGGAGADMGVVEGVDKEGKPREAFRDGYQVLYRDPDVLDTWFSSGLWPIGTLGWPNWTDETKKYFPTSTLVTGQDILFFWVARMMMMQLEVTGEIPFDTVYLHQLVRDEKGVKMSKTLGNVIDPLDMIDEYGADAVRFTMTSMAALGGSLKLSMERVKGYRNFGTKLWNTFSFAEHYDIKFQPENPCPQAQSTLNKWIIGETAKTLEEVDAALKSYRFNDAALTLYAFVRGKVCDWYVELTKPILQGDDAAAKAEVEQTLTWVLDQCLILLHPIMPFITEELWQISNSARDNMLVHQDWPTYTVADLVDTQADREMNWVIALIEQVRSVRTELRVNAGAKIPMIQLDLDKAAQKALDGNLAMIKRLARIDALTTATDAPKGAITLAVEGGTFCLPLADIIDVAAEKARLQKALDKLGKEAGGLKGKLSNQKFIANAPAEIVETQRVRLAAIDEELATLNAAFARIDALGS